MPFPCLGNSYSAFKNQHKCHLLSESFPNKEEVAALRCLQTTFQPCSSSLKLCAYPSLQLYLPSDCELLVSKSASLSSLSLQWPEHRMCSTNISWREEWINVGSEAFCVLVSALLLIICGPEQLDGTCPDFNFLKNKMKEYFRSSQPYLMILFS